MKLVRLFKKICEIEEIISKFPTRQLELQKDGRRQLKLNHKKDEALEIILQESKSEKILTSPTRQHR